MIVRLSRHYLFQFLHPFLHPDIAWREKMKFSNCGLASTWCVTINRGGTFFHQKKNRRAISSSSGLNTKHLHRPELHFAIQVGDTLRCLETCAIHGLQRFVLSFNRTAVIFCIDLRFRFTI